ncbi:N-acetylmuramidase family protein [Galbibacter sp. EGI 63066]|uniref:N-acetylmuramidase family protein n=1 Tax=Galbibacter sp. EGI 63066 TaxID=2993559 RepID=UPI0022492138|nr:N-acetylmuramidase family protein [Galbibacter sp. EGI 63066]MCX2681493.1 N-acetylmuramidase family protein [Galbibacter sp. EGI 63066]
MKTLKYRSYGQTVYLLEQILNKLGYNVIISKYFGKDTDAAVRDFQRTNNLVIDGIVGIKTWSKLLALKKELLDHTDKLLAEKDLLDFAKTFDLELAVVKAVNEVESHGSGFLISGKAKILFEGHIFWRQLKKRNVDPKKYQSKETAHVLYKKWTRKHYVGGEGEYTRLNDATSIKNTAAFHEAAHASASWGVFQIMGYHYESLGYESIDDFVNRMQEHEREHLIAFGRYLKVNKLIDSLQKKDWKRFARAYNGSSYKKNHYDERLEKAYLKYHG